MPGLWDGYEFVDGELELWSREIFSAAMEMPAAERRDFLASVCAGNDELKTRVQSLIDQAWELDAGPPRDQVYRPGTVIRDCVLLSKVGQGGMAEVYKAIQRSLRRVVAVKVLTAGDGDLSSALAVDAISASRLQHPNIAAIHDAELGGDRPCVVMEYVDGVSLRTWLDRHWRKAKSAPPRGTVTSIVRQIALALREAHGHGIVHRDIKPENILLAKRGEDYHVKVVDFGVARRIKAPRGQVLGTAGYIAPELLDGARPDERADLFSVGVVLYEILTGRHPFAGGTDAEILYNTATKEAPRPEHDALPDLFAVASTALRKTAADRYQSVDELIADLDGLQPAARASTSNPLLSELPEFARRWCDDHASGFAVAATSLAWGCLSAILSIAASAACVRVLWSGPAGAPGFEMIFGYLVEANAGLWYIFGASLCAMAGFGFLHAAHRGLARTAQLKAVSSGRGDSDPLDRIADRNRRYFRYLSPVIVVAALGFVLIPEVAFRENHAFGWVQADTAARHVGATYDDLRRAGKIGDLAPLANVCRECTVSVAAVYNRSESFQPPSRLWFTLFLVSALGHQIAFTIFMTWVVFKVLFFFGLLSTALLGGGASGVRLVPDLDDKDDYRFGLGWLDNVYYAILLLIAAGAAGRLLQVAANAPKGTYFFGGDPAPALIGQPVLLLTVLIMLAVLVLTPIGVFLFLAIRAVDEELGRLSVARKSLESQRASARSAEARERLQSEIELLRERRDTAKKQSLLPIRQPVFIGLMAVNLLLLVLIPLSADWFGGAARARGDRAWRAINTSICAACGNAPQTTPTR